jgi:D-alanyl-D-alanine carboxypeptidase
VTKRNADLTKLLEWGFDQWARFPLVREGERYATAAVPFAEGEPLELVAAARASELVRLGDGSRFVERVVAPEMVELPVTKGQKRGDRRHERDARSPASTHATRESRTPRCRAGLLVR